MTLDQHLIDDELATRQIRELLEETLFVEAGAGTGKTQALVNRYVSLVLAGKAVERLVAITFTEKAAAELRDRVRGRLEEERSSAPDSEVIATALASLDRAPISTIHAFAYASLRSFAAQAGIDPDFEVQDEIASERRFEERWRQFLESLAGEREAVQAISRVLRLGLTTANIETLARELWSNTAVAEALAVDPLTSPAVPWPEPASLRDALVSLGLDRVPAGDLLRGRIEAVLRFLERLEAAPATECEAILANGIATLPTSFSTSGRAPNWGGATRIEAARTTATQVVAALTEHLAALRSEAFGKLLPIVLRFVTGEARSRQREGRLTYDDLILRLRDILRDNAAARSELRRRYDAVLIDEFQDTDPLQVEIALAFADAGSDGSIEPGRLFFVGDPKQSIYRFRRADMAVYERTCRSVDSARGRFLQLAVNRRSRAPLIDWLNGVFERLIGVGDRPEVQPPYRAIHSTRAEAVRGPAVAWTGGEADLNARDLRRLEAGQVAAYCLQALSEGWGVVDRAESSVRPAAFRDIAVLIPTRTVLQPLEQALTDARIPYRVEGGSLIYGTQEVRDLINCLTAIDDPTDEVAIVAALRSPAYACSDVDLARHKLGGGGFSYLSPRQEDTESPVAAALQSLRRFHELRQRLSLTQLVEGFVGDRRLIEAGVFDAGNRNPFRRARFVVEQARAFEASRPESLRSFVSWLERRAGDAILDSEGAGLDDDEDAVRILTVHAAKGLEFSIVFLAGLGIPPPNRPNLLLQDRASNRIALSIGSRGRQFKLGPYDQLSVNEGLHARAERDRLLYVAATRARDHLIVSLFHRKGGSESAARRLIDAGACDGAVELPPIAPVVLTATPLQGLSVEVPDLDDQSFLVEREALIKAAQRHVYTSATALGGRPTDDTDNATVKPERDDETEPWSRGRGGTHRGRAVHAALQSLAWDAGDEMIDAVARAQAVAEAIPEESGRIAALIRRALASNAAGRARTASRARREVPFAFRQDAVTVEGFIDLVIEGADGGLEVVDWKTDAVPAAAVSRRLEEYELQAGLYVLGVETATGRNVSRLTYVFVDPMEERSPGEPRALAVHRH